MKKREVKQHSKKWIDRWQVFVMVWLSVFFVADICMNKCEHLESLSITLVTSIVATIIPFLAKSYFETKEEKRMSLLERGDINDYGDVCEISDVDD